MSTAYPGINIDAYASEIMASLTIFPSSMETGCPKLNHQENVWQFMRENWLSNRIFSSYENIVDQPLRAN